MLSARPNLVIYTVPPSLSGRYRETFRPSGAKSDARDAEMLLEILALHRDQLRPRRPDTVATGLLQGLCVERRRLVEDLVPYWMMQKRTRQTHRLTACLGNYFPQALRWFADVDAPLMAAVLEKWGQLRAMQRSHPGLWLSSGSASYSAAGRTASSTTRPLTSSPSSARTLLSSLPWRLPRFPHAFLNGNKSPASRNSPDDFS